LRGYAKQDYDFPIDLMDILLTEALPYGAHHFGLTGGEPYLHPQFQQIVEKVVSFGYSWHFVSNGQVSEPYLRLMEQYKKQFKYASISIDGATAATHDRIRGKKGAFDRAVETVKTYVRSGFNVRISTTLNRDNHLEAESIIQLAQNLGARSIGFAGTIPTSWNQSLVMSDQELDECWKTIRDLRQNSQFDIRTVSALHTRGGVNFCNILNMRNLTFNARGELMFCCDTTLQGAIIGSLVETQLSDLIDRWIDLSSALQKHRAKRISDGMMGSGFDTCTFCNHFFEDLIQM
jgi:molybdenum cofactor biosynthesis enzyme MoaA